MRIEGSETLPEVARAWLRHAQIRSHLRIVVRIGETEGLEECGGGAVRQGNISLVPGLVEDGLILFVRDASDAGVLWHEVGHVLQEVRPPWGARALAAGVRRALLPSLREEHRRTGDTARIYYRASVEEMLAEAFGAHMSGIDPTGLLDEPGIREALACMLREVGAPSE